MAKWEKELLDEEKAELAKAELARENGRLIYNQTRLKLKNRCIKRLHRRLIKEQK